MKLKGDYNALTQYSAGDVVRWTDGTAMMARETVTGIPPTNTASWERLPQYMWDVVTLILDSIGISIDISKATLDSRITEDAIALKGAGDEPKEYVITVDESGDDPDLAVTEVTEEEADS